MAKKKAKTSAKTRHPLAQAPLDELAAELSRRRAALPKLVKRRRKLQQEIAELDQQIEMLEGLDGGSGGRGSGTKKKSATKKKSTAGGATRRGRGGGPTMRDKIGEVLGGDGQVYKGASPEQQKNIVEASKRSGFFWRWQEIRRPGK